MPLQNRPALYKSLPKFVNVLYLIIPCILDLVPKITHIQLRLELASETKTLFLIMLMLSVIILKKGKKKRDEIMLNLSFEYIILPNLVEVYICFSKYSCHLAMFYSIK